MRVEMNRSGGFAGLSVSAAADRDALPPDLAATLDRLLDDPPRAAARGPDRYTYTLRGGGREAEISEAALPPEGKRLVAWLMEHGRG